MNVLIKGMEMPTKCIICPLEMYGYCLANNKKNVGKSVVDFVKDEDCPLIPVPPHGKLGDLDAMYEVVKKRTKNWAGGWNDIECVITGNDIKNAPTIIEAEEGEI